MMKNVDIIFMLKNTFCKNLARNLSEKVCDFSEIFFACSNCFQINLFSNWLEEDWSPFHSYFTLRDTIVCEFFPNHLSYLFLKNEETFAFLFL